MRIIITIILIVFAATTRAQEVKYDSAIISYYLLKHTIYVSINGKEYKGDTIQSLPGESPENLNPFINKIQEMEKRDWLCIDIKNIPSTNGSRAYLAYLRRKKVE
jgi:hypothetical protein